MLQERGAPNQPEFKNWFYVKNSITVEEGFKAILEENYFTEVKVISNSLTPVNDTDEEPEVTTSEELSKERLEGSKAVEQEIIQSLSENNLKLPGKGCMLLSQFIIKFILHK